MTNLHALPDQLLLEVFHFTCAKDLFQFRLSSKSFNNLITKSDIANALWSEKLKLDFNYDEESEGHESFTCIKINEDANERRLTRIQGRSIFGHYLSEDPLFTSNSAFEAYKYFCKANEVLYQNVDPFPKLNASYILRAARIWYELASWCVDPNLDPSGPDFKFRSKLLQSLDAGIERYRGRFSRKVESKILSTFIAADCLFAFCDGQIRPMDAQTAALSLFGGFQAYNYVSLMMLVGTFEVTNFQKSNELILANDIISGLPSIALSLQSGNVEMLTSSNHSDESKGDRLFIASGQDAALTWFENHVRKLVHGEIEVITGSRDDHPFDEDWTYISSFPTARSSRASRCVTRGIEVIASAIPAHEIDTIVYSIRIRMLKEGEEGYLTPQQREFETCQLHTRHWKLVNLDSNDVDRVNGEGVIGKFPILFEGGYVNGSGERNLGSFIYQSCTGREMNNGTFEGHMSFIPGSIRQPTGEPFNVRVGQFELSMSPSLL